MFEPGKQVLYRKITPHSISLVRGEVEGTIELTSGGTVVEVKLAQGEIRDYRSNDPELWFTQGCSIQGACVGQERLIVGAFTKGDAAVARARIIGVDGFTMVLGSVTRKTEQYAVGDSMRGFVAEIVPPFRLRKDKGQVLIIGVVNEANGPCREGGPTYVIAQTDSTLRTYSPKCQD